MNIYRLTFWKENKKYISERWFKSRSNIMKQIKEKNISNYVIEKFKTED